MENSQELITCWIKMCTSQEKNEQRYYGSEFYYS
jgi:hypothetical protein